MGIPVYLYRGLRRLKPLFPDPDALVRPMDWRPEGSSGSLLFRMSHFYFSSRKFLGLTCPPGGGGATARCSIGYPRLDTGVPAL